MSELDDAFNDAMDAAEEAQDVRETVLFRSQELDAVVSDNQLDIEPAFGGIANSGTVTVAMRLSDLDDAPESGEAITVRGEELSVLSVEWDRSTWTVTAGDATQ